MVYASAWRVSQAWAHSSVLAVRVGEDPGHLVFDLVYLARGELGDQRRPVTSGGERAIPGRLVNRRVRRDLRVGQKAMTAAHQPGDWVQRRELPIDGLFVGNLDEVLALHLFGDQ